MHHYFSLVIFFPFFATLKAFLISSFDFTIIKAIKVDNSLMASFKEDSFVAFEVVNWH